MEISTTLLIYLLIGFFIGMIIMRFINKNKSIGLLNDFTKALGQQLYFWGCDVTHPSGNLLCEYGLERRKNEDVKGSSCYRIKYQDDIIELHGLCVGRYSQDKVSFLYTRKHRRCWVYEDNLFQGTQYFTSKRIWFFVRQLSGFLRSTCKSKWIHVLEHNIILVSEI